jgi:L-alanine-DL-glutamate epimerase-like enolase superfamily enzyme
MHGPKRALDSRIDQLHVSAYTVPTDFPESDGTLQWDKTTIVIVEPSAAGRRGLGYTYADTSVATLIHSKLRDVVIGCDAMNVPETFLRMLRSLRNLGRPGIVSMAISAVDIALWDLKAKILDLPLTRLLGAVRDSIAIYASGGFTSYSDEQLRDQLGGWADKGFSMMKMKIGREPGRDLHRVRVARKAVGDHAALFVDANGAYSRKQALAFARRFQQEFDVRWFEEPVSSDDLEGLRLIRNDGPPGMDIAAGEYGYDPFYFRRMLDAEAVDILQADATRCGGVTGFIDVDAQCLARPIPLSAHTAPSIHMHLCCVARAARNLEYFHDHQRIERIFFDGFVEPHNGFLRPSLSRHGLGLELRRSDIQKFAA